MNSVLKLDKTLDVNASVASILEKLNNEEDFPEQIAVHDKENNILYMIHPSSVKGEDREHIQEERMKIISEFMPLNPQLKHIINKK